MFTGLTLSQRIQVGLILVMAFLLVLGSNRLDRRHFSRIQTTVNAVYEDRVVVQDFIYKLNNIFHQKELRLAKGEALSGDPSTNKVVERLLTDFRATELTSRESKLLNELNRQFENLKGLENQGFASINELNADTGFQMMETLDRMERTLDGLAQVQLEESGQLTAISNKSLGTKLLLSKLEMGFLLILGLAIVALIFHPITYFSTAQED